MKKEKNDNKQQRKRKKKKAKRTRKESMWTTMGREKGRIHKGRERKGRRTITSLQSNCKSN